MSHPWWTNVMTQVNWVIGDERVVVVLSVAGGQNRTLWPEEKSVSCMKDLCGRLSKGE